MFTDYKANRPPTPPELKQHIPRVIEMVRNMGVPLLMTSGVEADDIIGTVARRGIESGLHVSVVSPDKDFFQLLGPRVRQLRPNGRNGDASNGGDYDTQKAGDGGGAAGTNGFGPHGFKELSARGLVSIFLLFSYAYGQLDTDVVFLTHRCRTRSAIFEPSFAG